LTPLGTPAMLAAVDTESATMAQAAKYKILHELGTGGMGKVYKGLLVASPASSAPSSSSS
jgi:hypothetical protein